MEGWIVAHFTKGTGINVCDQWLEEEEDYGRGKWEDVSATIEFSAGNNGDRGVGRESVCMRYRVIISILLVAGQHPSRH